MMGHETSTPTPTYPLRTLAHLTANRLVGLEYRRIPVFGLEARRRWIVFHRNASRVETRRRKKEKISIYTLPSHPFLMNNTHHRLRHPSNSMRKKTRFVSTISNWEPLPHRYFGHRTSRVVIRNLPIRFLPSLYPLSQ